MAIRNIVFDVGNVIVPWDPLGIERVAFGSERIAEPDYVSPFRGNPVWLAVNRGELSLEQAKDAYEADYGFDRSDIDRLYVSLRASFPLISDTVAMMQELRSAGYRLFAITDNVHEIVAQLKRDYSFWELFDHAAVSAELGVLKPDPKIYQWLLEAAGIDPTESVFMDDVQRNVDGAIAQGMRAFVFTDASAARSNLQALGVAVGEAA